MYGCCKKQKQNKWEPKSGRADSQSCGDRWKASGRGYTRVLRTGTRALGGVMDAFNSVFSMLWGDAGKVIIAEGWVSILLNETEVTEVKFLLRWS